jgi:hypothetical protein
MVFLLVACGDDGTVPDGTLRFGQVGEVSLALEVPLLFRGGAGELRQALTWNSGGAWQLRESISYRGLLGDENLTRKQGDPGTYASLIAQLNESPVLKLFEDLEPEVPDPCAPGATKVTLTVWDEVRKDEKTFVRCSEGSLATLKTSEAGPDPEAVRVIQAAILVRDFTEGTRFLSAYSGSVPFGTLDRSEDSGALLDTARAFYSEREGSLDTPDDWVPFWRAHKGKPAAHPPVIDWAHEMVLVAAVGKRMEAGDSIEIRQVLQTGEGTQVNLFERVPGDFCSPAATEHYPVHIVVAPRTLLPPVHFSHLKTERVPCGL